MPKKFVDQYKKSEQELSDLIGRGLNNIKEKHERIKAYEREIIPAEYF